MNRRFLFLSALSSLLAVTIMRVLSCEIGFLGYYQNYLLACVLFGLSLGFIDAAFARSKLPAAGWFFSLTILLVLVAIGHFTVLPYAGAIRDASTFFLDPRYLDNDFVHELMISIVVFVAFTLTIRCFLPLGSSLAALLSGMSAERAFTIFVVGALIGWGVYFLSLSLALPPAVLVGLLGASFLLLAGRRWASVFQVTIALSASLACNFFVAPAGEGPYPSPVQAKAPAYFRSFWTPEGHVQTYPFLVDGELAGFGISTNQCAADFVIDTGLDARRCQELATGHESLKNYWSGYFDIPYIGRQKPQKVLILAGGSGNEVAEALRCGAGHVDALDWRPWMFKLGEAHPLKPFASASVRKLLADPRQFLKESTEKYDIIVFGRLEGLSSFSPFGLLRTDDFRYTLESFIDAQDNLAPGGFVALSCKPYLRWYAWRLAHGLQLGNGNVDAILELPFRGYMFAGREKNEPLAALFRKIFKPTEFLNVDKVMKYAKDIRPTFDDWPFLYAARANVPVSNLYCLVVMMVAMLIQMRPLLKEDADYNRQGQPSAVLFDGQNWRVMLLAAGFMVAAGKLVMTLAFNFGTAWQTAIAGAALVGICALLPAAVAPAARRLPAFIVWSLGFAACAVDYTFNYESVVTIVDPWLRLLAAGVLPLTPAFFVSMILVRNIADPPAPKLTFGMLFFGLLLGKFVEHACLFSTIADLDLACILLCVAAMIIRPKRAVLPAEVQLEEPPA